MSKFEATTEQIETAKKMIEKLVEVKATVSFGEAAVNLGLIEETKEFRGSMCSPVIAIFDATMEGGSALLVDQNGKYATRTETEGHPATLQALGYTEIPTYKPRASRKGGKMALAKKLLAFSKENDCSIDDAIALHKLSQNL
jgi:hypothetical protein